MFNKFIKTFIYPIYKISCFMKFWKSSEKESDNIDDFIVYINDIGVLFLIFTMYVSLHIWTLPISLYTSIYKTIKLFL